MSKLGIEPPPPLPCSGAAGEQAALRDAPLAAVAGKVDVSEHAVRLSVAMRTIVNSITKLVTVWECEILPFQHEDPDLRWWRQIKGDSTMYSRQNKLYNYLKALWERKATQSHGQCTTAVAKSELTRLLQQQCDVCGGLGNLEKDLTTAIQLAKGEAQKRGEDASNVLVRLADVANAADLRKLHAPVLLKKSRENLKRKRVDRKGVTVPGMHVPIELQSTEFVIGDLLPVHNNPNAMF